MATSEGLEPVDYLTTVAMIYEILLLALEIVANKKSLPSIVAPEIGRRKVAVSLCLPLSEPTPVIQRLVDSKNYFSSN